MLFEHTLVVNEDGRAYTMTRAELWQGLKHRAIDPTAFYHGLESCRIVDRRELPGDVLELDRELNFGPFVVKDTVQLFDEQRIITVVPETDLWPKSEATVFIDVSDSGELLMRCQYIWHHSDQHPPLETAYLEIRQQAYIDADADALQKIYEMTKLKRSLI